MLQRLNAYRLMWVFVYFDLPSVTKKEKKRYRIFKSGLEENGFQMLQYSIYVRHCTSREMAEVHKKRVKKMLPVQGHIVVHYITDKQFAMMEVYHSAKKRKQESPPGQLTLF